MNTSAKVAFALVALAAATQAHAFFRPGANHAYQTAQMKIARTTGRFADVKTVDLTRFRTDGARGLEAEGFTLVIDGREETFRLIEKKDIGCGSFQLTARLETMRMGVGTTLVLIDHTHRICEDYRPFLWNLKVQSRVIYPNAPVSHLEADGNPETLFTAL